MWSFGTAIDPKRPACECLVALPGLINPQLPHAFAIIDLADWPHWQGWQWILIAIEPTAEARVVAWQATHPDG